MATLKSEHKTFIVTALARYQSPTEIADAVKVEFDLDITRQQVRFYNPLQNDKCPESWRDLFETERAAFLEKLDRIGIANTAYRLMRLDGMLTIILSSARPNMILALDVLKQAAQDVGGLFEAKRDVQQAAPQMPLSIEAAILKIYGERQAPTEAQPQGNDDNPNPKIA